MKTHPTALNNITSYEDLGRQIVAMRYDCLAQVLRGMLQEANRQQTNDDAEGKVKLAYRLGELAGGIETALEASHEVMRICRPHIEAEKEYLRSIDAPSYSKRQIMWNVEGS